MMTLPYAQQLEILQDAIFAIQEPTQCSWIKPSGKIDFSGLERLEVYRKAYRVRLIEAVAADYPATAHYMGEQKFYALVRAYVREHPSKNWDLNLYSVKFADFLAQASEDPGAWCLGRYESAITDIFWQAESPRVDADFLGRLDEAGMEQTLFQMCPASRVMELAFDAEAWCASVRAGQGDCQLAARPVRYHLVRTAWGVVRLEIGESHFKTLQKLETPTSLNAVFLHATGQGMSEAEISGAVAQWIQYGALRMAGTSA